MLSAEVVLSVIAKRSNGSLIAAVAKLYIKPTDTVIDSTWGRGKWWSEYQHPGPFIAHDKYTLDGVDFCALPESDASVDVVAYDPPFLSKGGRTTSGIPDFDDRYGLVDAPGSPEAMRQWIGLGIAEAARVLRPKGLLLCKVADYISSATYQCGLESVLSYGRGCGLRLEDLFIHFSGTGPQPKTNRDGSPRRQVHSRRSHSYLVVSRKL